MFRLRQPVHNPQLQNHLPRVTRRLRLTLDRIPTRLAEKPPHHIAGQRVRVFVEGEVVGAGDGDAIGFYEEVCAVDCARARQSGLGRRVGDVMGSGWGGEDEPEPAVFWQFLQWQMWPRRWPEKRSGSLTCNFMRPQLQAPSIVFRFFLQFSWKRGGFGGVWMCFLDVEGRAVQ